MNHEYFSHIFSDLIKFGVNDVYVTPIQMKKNRPATKLTVICNKEIKNIVERYIFRETTSIGIRNHQIDRTILDRKYEKLETEFGEITIKKCYLDKELINESIEYEDLKRIAKQNFKSVKEIARILYKLI